MGHGKASGETAPGHSPSAAGTALAFVLTSRRR